MDPILIYAGSAALAGILLSGAIGKLASFARFENATAGYALLPANWVRPFAALFIAAELCSGMMLLVPTTRAGGAALAMAVLLLASAGIVANLLRGRRDIDCGCGGFTEKTGGLSWWLVLRNSLLLALAVPALLAHYASARSLSWVDALTFFGTTLAVLGLYFCLNQLIDSHQRIQKT
ncbi:methylamine utilization protein MauE [Allopusillimonas ginsengisoli]|nr:methylamine utilization protein MauE [Allopusillimonas ginsengisoli]